MLSLLLTVVALADPPAPIAKSVPTKVTAVTMYPGRASVTRTGKVIAPAGLHEWTVSPLPPTIQPETLQASVEGGGVKVVSVEHRAVPIEGAAAPAHGNAIARARGVFPTPTNGANASAVAKA